MKDSLSEGSVSLSEGSVQNVLPPAFLFLKTRWNSLIIIVQPNLVLEKIYALLSSLFYKLTLSFAEPV